MKHIVLAFIMLFMCSCTVKTDCSENAHKNLGMLESHNEYIIISKTMFRGRIDYWYEYTVSDNKNSFKFRSKTEFGFGDKIKITIRD